MAYIAKQSQEVLNKDLMLFPTLPTSVGIEKMFWTEHQTLGTIRENTPFEFNIPGTGGHYTKLDKSRLKVRAKIVKADGTNPSVVDYGPVNIPLHSAWQQVDVYLQDRLLSSAGTNYPYLAYAKTLLNTDVTTKETEMTSQLYYHDTAGFMDATDPLLGSNGGLAERYSAFISGNEVDIEGPLLEDIFSTSRPLVKGVDIKIKLWPSKNTFRLQSAKEEYRLVITDIILKLCRLNVDYGLMTSHMEMMKTVTAKYPYIHSDIKTYALPSGQFNFNLDDIFQGQRPTHVAFMMVSGEAYNGSYSKNPYNFQHFNLNYLSCEVDGQSVPGKAYQPKFNKTGGQNFISCFKALYSETGIWGDNRKNGITREDFPEGYSVFLFELESSPLTTPHFPLIKQGNVKLEGRFDSALSETVIALVIGTFPAQFEVDAARNIL